MCVQGLDKRLRGLKREEPGYSWQRKKIVLTSEKEEFVGSIRAQLQLENKKLYFPEVLSRPNIDNTWLD